MKPGSDDRENAFPEGRTVSTSGWLTAAEAAAYLKVKPRSLLLWVRQGKIPAYALAGTKRRVWRFRQQDLDQNLLENAVYNSAPPAVLNENRRTQ